ncbi:hypothetical protein MY4038_008417 [Beauveria bassiana]
MVGTQHDTPKKARLRGAFEFLEYQGLPFRRKDLYEFFEVSPRQGQVILDDPDASCCTRHNSPIKAETRGRKRAFSSTDLDSIEALIEDEGFEARQLPWTTLALEATEVDATGRTIRDALARRSLHKRIA